MDGDTETIETECYQDGAGRRNFEPVRVLECGHLVSLYQKPWVGGDVEPLPDDFRRTPSDTEESHTRGGDDK